MRVAATWAASVFAPCANPGVWFLAFSGVGMPVGGGVHMLYVSGGLVFLALWFLGLSVQTH